MKSRLYIHLHDSDAISVSWAKLGRDESRPAEVLRGQLDTIPEPDEDTHVTVFVPATDVLLTEVTIPSRNRRQLASATPYALEDQLIDDVEDLHFALGKSDDEGVTRVATVANNKLQQWLSRLADNNIRADAFYSEAQSLPVNENSWSLLQLDGRCVLRGYANQAYGLDCANLSSFVERMAANEDNLPADIHVISCAGDTAAQADFAKALPLNVQQHECPGDALVSLIEGCQSAPGINLLQGRFENRRPVLTGMRRWIPAVAMLFIWLVLQFGVLIADKLELSGQEEQLKEDITALYKQAVPDAKRVVNARVQMQQQLDSLKGGGTQSGFLDLLARGGEVFSKTTGVVINSLSYRDGSMDIALTLKDLQGLDNIKQSLIDKLGVEVDIQSATPKADIIEARLRIRRKS